MAHALPHHGSDILLHIHPVCRPRRCLYAVTVEDARRAASGTARHLELVFDTHRIAYTLRTSILPHDCKDILHDTLDSVLN